MSSSFNTKETILKINRKYCNQLESYPLSTKAITLAFFALFNEQLASFFAGDIKKLNVKIPLTKYSFFIPHTLTSKVPLMGLFALIINAPLTHYGYRIIQKLVPSPLTPRKRLLQILLSTGVITPIFCACFVSWIGLINNLSKFKNIFKNNENDKSLTLKLKSLISVFIKTVVSSLKSSYIRVVSTSIVTSPVFMFLAQKFIIPEAWAVFFAFCYFIVGTYNNTKVKILQKKLREQGKTSKEDQNSVDKKNL